MRDDVADMRMAGPTSIVSTSAEDSRGADHGLRPIAPRHPRGIFPKGVRLRQPAFGQEAPAPPMEPRSAQIEPNDGHFLSVSTDQSTVSAFLACAQ